MSVEIRDGFARRYVYPMSNATNGGETNSEYNVRSALSNIITYSAAFSYNDFDLNRNPREVCDYDYANHLLKLHIGPGRGNCNSYFVNCSELGSDAAMATFSFDPEQVVVTSGDKKISDYSDNTWVDFGLYVSVVYNQTIADGVIYRFVSVDGSLSDNYAFVSERDTIYDVGYRPQGFSDIGILLGTMRYTKSGGSGTFGDFIPNPSRTKCLDISKFGDGEDIAKLISDFINRLAVLNIYGGNFYISDMLDDEGNDIGEDGVEALYGGDFRLRIHEDVQSGATSNKKKIVGGMDLVKVNLGGSVDVVQDLITFATNEFTIPVSDISTITINEFRFNQNAVFSGNISVTGNTVLGGTLGVVGNTTLGGTLGVSGNATIGGNTTTTGLSATGNATIGGTLGVTGATTISGNLGVGGNAAVSGDVEAANIEVTYDVEAENISASSTMSVNGITLQKATVESQDTLDIPGKYLRAVKVFGAVWN